jgi:hypothetical protein
MSISDFAEVKLLNAVFKNVTYAVAQTWVSLHTGDPGEAGDNEVAGGDYARQMGSFASAVSGATSNDATIAYASMPSVTVSHVGIWDASSGGNFIWGGALTQDKPLTLGDIFQINPGNLDVSLD